MPISDYLRGLREKVGTQMLLVPSATVVVRDDEGRILLVRHADSGLWVVPGGSMLPYEGPADAAVREMREETGLEVELVRVVGVYGGAAFVVRYSNGDRISYAMITFEGRIVGGAARPDRVETLEVGWFTEAQLASMPLATWAKIVVRDAFRPGERTAFAPPLRGG